MAAPTTRIDIDERTARPAPSEGAGRGALATQRAGGIAALVEAGTFVFGFALFATLLSEYTTGDPTPAESVAFAAGNEAALYVWNTIILIVFGVVLVPLVLALHDRLGGGALARVAGAFGLLWAGLVIAAGMIANVGLGTVVDLYEAEPASAVPVWSALDSVENGLGGGNEIVGGLWVLLVSFAAQRTRVLPTGLNRLGTVAGAAGLVTIAPALEAAGAVFGLGLIAWFTWLGLVLLRGAAHRSARGAAADRTA